MWCLEVIILKFTLGEINKNAFNEPFTFEREIDVSDLADLPNDIRKIKPVQVQGSYALDGEEIIFTLNMNGEMILPCARTLVDVPYAFEINEVEIFTTSEYMDAEKEEDEIHPVEGEVIDLGPYIKENIMLAIPYRVFSDDEEALKNARFEGEGWTYTLEEDEDDDNEQKNVIDPRLQKLQELLNDKED